MTDTYKQKRFIELCKLDLEDQESKGCTVALAEWLSIENVNILRQFLIRLVSC